LNVAPQGAIFIAAASAVREDAVRLDQPIFRYDGLP